VFVEAPIKTILHHGNKTRCVTAVYVKCAIQGSACPIQATQLLTVTGITSLKLSCQRKSFKHACNPSALWSITCSLTVYTLINAYVGDMETHVCFWLLWIDMSIGNRSYTLTGLWLLCAVEWKAKILKWLHVSTCSVVQSRASNIANGEYESVTGNVRCWKACVLLTAIYISHIVLINVQQAVP
jgi:hypothetical protein